MPNDSEDQPPPGGGGKTPWWEDLSAHSEEADVREEIARLIREGKVRVRLTRPPAVIPPVMLPGMTKVRSTPSALGTDPSPG
jgi:hypothetical protein